MTPKSMSESSPKPRRATCGCIGFPTRYTRNPVTLRPVAVTEWEIPHIIGVCRGSDNAKVESFEDVVVRLATKTGEELNLYGVDLRSLITRFTLEALDPNTITHQMVLAIYNEAEVK